MPDNIITPEFRLSFPNLFRPRKQSQDADAKEKYSLSMLFPAGTDLAKLKAAANAAARDKWGDKVGSMKLKTPFLDAADYEYEGYGAGMVLIRASSIQKPGIVDAKVQPILDESEVYPGCYGRASLRAFAYDTSGNKGVSFGIVNFQKTRDGEPLGGRSRPEQDFEPVADESVTAGGERNADSVFA